MKIPEGIPPASEPTLVEAYVDIALLHSPELDKHACGVAAGTVIYKKLRQLQRHYWPSEKFQDADDAVHRVWLRLSSRRRQPGPETEDLAIRSLAVSLFRAIKIEPLGFPLIFVDPSEFGGAPDPSLGPEAELIDREATKERDGRVKEWRRLLAAARGTLRTEIIPAAADRIRRRDARQRFVADIERLTVRSKANGSAGQSPEAESIGSHRVAAPTDSARRRILNAEYQRRHRLFLRLVDQILEFLVPEVPAVEKQALWGALKELRLDSRITHASSETVLGNTGSGKRRRPAARKR